MTVAELMQGFTPDPQADAYTLADDMVLAVDFQGDATDPTLYTLAQIGITEHSGALSPQTKDSQYIRQGQVTTKTGTSRSFTVNGDRQTGDAFQNALLSHALKYGTGQTVIKPYVYFNKITGLGEQGNVSIAVNDDLGGGAGDNASFSATLTSTGTPTEYAYGQPTPPTP